MENVKKHVQTGNKKHKKTTLFPQKSDINNITQKARQSHFNMTKTFKTSSLAKRGSCKIYYKSLYENAFCVIMTLSS